ncbi:MAG TPA: ATPase, partial [Anaerolineae bacterium]|nr:ATPase [Anaerolineae bacterium]
IEVEFREKRVRITVHDDGNGFDLRGRMSDLVSMGKFGLIGIEERVQLLGGQFSVLTSKGKGTIVVVDVPA